MILWNTPLKVYSNLKTKNAKADRARMVKWVVMIP